MDSIENIFYSDYYNVLSLRNANLLGAGKSYVINDYQAVWKIPDRKDGLCDTASVYEPLILTAVSQNQFSPVAVSISHPYDFILYSIDNNDTLFGWAAGEGKGVIYERRDFYNNRLYYDFRHITFRRYCIEYDRIEKFSTVRDVLDIGYKTGDIVRDDNNNIYVYIPKIKSREAGNRRCQSLSLNENEWVMIYNGILLNNPGFISPYPEDMKIDFLNADGNSEIIQAVIPINPEKYSQMYTFNDEKYNRNLCDEAGKVVSNEIKNSMGDYGGYSSLMNSVCAWTLPNTVFNVSNNYDYKFLLAYNRFIGEARCNHIEMPGWNNVFNDGFNGNLIGWTLYPFSNNTFAVNFKRNTICGGFEKNQIGMNCMNNIFSRKFSANSVERGMRQNVFSCRFTDNSIGKNTEAIFFSRGSDSKTFPDDYCDHDV
jgi:hypothetical protein